MVHPRLVTALPLASLATALVFAGTCTCEDAPPPKAGVDLTALLGDGEVRCGPVQNDAELIGGPGAFGQVGRSYRCNNARIRFLVQDGSRPVGNSSEGGTLIDVDRVRAGADGKQGPGEDTFRELVPGFGAKEMHVESIEVVNDGTNGEPGIIRVTGKPTDLSLAPQAYYLAQDMNGTLVTDYIMRPDVDYVEVKTTFKNDGELVYLQPADFVAFGGSTLTHTQEHGFGDLDLFAEVKMLSSGRGDFVSYTLLSPDADVIVPFIDAGITAPFYGTSVPVGSDRDYVRYLIVGDGTIESTTRVAMELKGLPRGTASGVVKDASGTPAEGVLVSALNLPLDDERAVVVNETRTGADGTWSLTMPPGTYQLLAHSPERGRAAPVEVEVADGGAATAAPIVIGARGTVKATTTFNDKAGADIGKLPSKLTLVPVDDDLRPLGVLRDFNQKGASQFQVTNDGVFSLDVPPGRYTAYVTRGFEFSRFEQQIDVVANETVTLAPVLAHVLDTTGLVGAEFHQHSLASIDAKVPVAEKVLENAAEGVEMAASTDHDVITDFRPYVEQLGLKPFFFAVAGCEVSYQGIGHFQAYPWNVDVADPFRDNGSKMWWKKTVPQMLEGVRAMAGDPIIQINHPRAQLTGYFTSLPFNPVDGTRILRDPPEIPTFPAAIYDEWASDFDAVEVNSGLGDVSLFTDAGRTELERRAHDEPESVPNLADYFALLGAGMKVVAMGNSDTHHIDEGVGYPRNFMRAETDNPAELDEEDLRDAIRGQHNSVGEGCLLELFVGGQRKSGMSEMISVDDLANIRVKLQAPEHVTPGDLAIFANGEARSYDATSSTLVITNAGDTVSRRVNDLKTDDPIARVDHALSGVPTTEGDLVILVASQGGTGLAPTGGASAMCYSAPLYVDVDGDGEFTGWLAGTQNLAP